MSEDSETARKVAALAEVRARCVEAMKEAATRSIGSHFEWSAGITSMACDAQAATVNALDIINVCDNWLAEQPEFKSERVS